MHAGDIELEQKSASLVLGRLSDLVELASSLLGLATKLSLILGFFFFWLYCTEVGIPMPVNIADLPVLLMAVAGLGLFILVILTGFLLMPLFCVIGITDRNLRALYRPKKAAWRTLVFTFSVPLFFGTYAAIFLFSDVDSRLWVIIFCGFAGALSFALSLYKTTKFLLPRTKIAIVSWSVAHFVIISAWLFLSFAFIAETPFIAWLVEQVPDSTFGKISLHIQVLLICLLFVAIALLQTWLGVLNNSGDEKRPSIFIFLPFMIISVAMIHPVSSIALARAALITMGLGGLRPICYSVLPGMPDDAKRELGVVENEMRYPILVSLTVGTRLFVANKYIDQVTKREKINSVEFPIEWFAYRRNPLYWREGDGKKILYCRAVGKTNLARRDKVGDK